MPETAIEKSKGAQISLSSAGCLRFLSQARRYAVRLEIRRQIYTLAEFFATNIPISAFEFEITSIDAGSSDAGILFIFAPLESIIFSSRLRRSDALN